MLFKYIRGVKYTILQSFRIWPFLMLPSRKCNGTNVRKQWKPHTFTFWWVPTCTLTLWHIFDLLSRAILFVLCQTPVKFNEKNTRFKSTKSPCDWWVMAQHRIRCAPISQAVSIFVKFFAVFYQTVCTVYTLIMMQWRHDSVHKEAERKTSGFTLIHTIRNRCVPKKHPQAD